MRFFLIIFLICANSFNGLAQKKNNVKIERIINIYERTKQYAEDSNFAKAVETLDSAIAIDSQDHSLYSFKSELLRMSKRYIEAADIQLKAVQLSGTLDMKSGTHLYGVYLHIGIQYEKGGDTCKAQENYLKGIFLFEKKRELSEDKYFRLTNSIDYAILLLLAGDSLGWEKEFNFLLKEYSHIDEVIELKSGKSREEIRDIYFRTYGG